jgi:Transcriptional regulator, AbiEi antitoxin
LRSLASREATTFFTSLLFIRWPGGKVTWVFRHEAAARSAAAHDTALKAFRNKGGTLRTRDLLALGVHTDALYALRESGRIVELGRGLYRLAETDETEHPDLAMVAARAPNAAVCLISALSYHGITTQLPSSIHIAVPRGSYHGIKLSVPVTVYRFDTKRVGCVKFRCPAHNHRADQCRYSTQVE